MSCFVLQLFSFCVGLYGVYCSVFICCYEILWDVTFENILWDVATDERWWCVKVRLARNKKNIRISNLVDVWIYLQLFILFDTVEESTSFFAPFTFGNSSRSAHFLVSHHIRTEQPFDLIFIENVWKSSKIGAVVLSSCYIAIRVLR